MIHIIQYLDKVASYLQKTPKITEAIGNKNFQDNLGRAGSVGDVLVGDSKLAFARTVDHSKTFASFVFNKPSNSLSNVFL